MQGGSNDVSVIVYFAFFFFCIKLTLYILQEINETAWHALFFDMGAASTKAVLVEYKTIKMKDKGYVETVPQLQILGVGFDRYGLYTF